MPHGAPAQREYFHECSSRHVKNGSAKAPAKTRTNGHVERKDSALRTSELRYRRLFESAQDGILILDGETGEIVDANPFLLDLLNFTFREVIGLKLWEIGQFKDIAANKEAFQQLQDNQYIRYEDLPLVARGGKHIQVEFVSNVYLVDDKKIIQCNIRDISARAKKQEASRAHLSALEVANNAKDEFLAALSHELRTPLSAISSMLDVLELGNRPGGRASRSDPDGTGWFERRSHSSQRSDPDQSH